MVRYPNIQEGLTSLYFFYFVGGSIFWGSAYFFLNYRRCLDNVAILLLLEYFICIINFIHGRKMGLIREEENNSVSQWLFVISFVGATVFAINFEIYGFGNCSQTTNGFLIANMVYHILYILSEIIIGIVSCFGVDISPYHYVFVNNEDNVVVNMNDPPNVQIRDTRPQPEQKYVVSIYGIKYDKNIEVPSEREFIVDEEANTIGIKKDKAICIFTQEAYPDKVSISILRCGHHFRKKYIKKHLETSYNCPICRHDQDEVHSLEGQIFG